MTIYGIKTCDSVRKALKFFKEHDMKYEFFDFKKDIVDSKKINQWLKHVELEKLFNSRGAKYRALKLKDLNLDDSGKKEWLAKENMLIKRPVIEYDDGVVVAYDEEFYKKIWSK